ncbi:transmembrane signal peptide protein [Sphingomonas sanxanigenens DSM 19645 = NX02]|uniref:Transmembrane signal peptide protein n=2 Tax=Sphingomonas sanxanigenens TaxID=397260 RepID=W0A9J2_9SPHN|nr:transmembrane signal peptide protein [Sphingomonas sanxanigenens DSM 19645 = NX02]
MENRPMPTIILLTFSNIFMTTAWYWHLKGGEAKPLWLVVLISWGIALIEYCLAVPANRIGYASGWSAGQLKIVQEALALVVFAGFMVWVLGEPLHWRHFAAFGCIMAGVAFLFVGR